MTCRSYRVPPHALAALRQIVDASGGELHLIVEDGQPVRCLYSGLDPAAIEALILRADLRPTGAPEAAPPSPPRSLRHLRLTA